MFEKRINTAEFLDSADFNPRLAYRSYKFMELVNRFIGGAEVVKNFIAREIPDNKPNSTIRILDMGSGACDIPLAVTKWASNISQRIEFTCLEINETALRVAKRNIKNSGFDSIVIKQENIFEFNPQQNFDYAVGSMFFHHFQDEQILTIIRKIRSFVKKGILINDLRRNVFSYIGCFFIVSFLPKEVRHDALLSIRKGFKANEIFRILNSMEKVDVTIETRNFSRLAVFIRFDGGEE